jgi:uncharacterized protein involved in response to NO
MTTTPDRANPLLQIAEPPRSGATPPPSVANEGMPLLRLGFRPFYLLAGAGATLLPLSWIGLLTGTLNFEPALPAVLWHGHEMIFGVVVAAIVGFLFTAGRLWTGLPTPTGGFLAAFALLWLAARVSALTGPYALFLMLDAAFLPLAAAVFFDLVVRSRNHRNLPMAMLLMLLAAANLAFHAAQLQLLPIAPTALLQSAVLVVVAVQGIVAGRVIPAFIGSAVPGSRPHSHAALERWLLPLTGLVVLLWAFAATSTITGVALATLAALHAVRWLLWRPWVARGRPILWILPLAYAWIPLGLALLACSSLDVLSASIGIHALAAGSMGALIVGMMSRTSRGHTGRSLVAGPQEVWAYRLVLIGAAVRVAAPLAGGAAVSWLLIAAALLWSVAFALLLWTLTPWLLAPRLDGKAG